MPRLQFLDGPAEFLAVAGAYLAASPVVNTVVTTVAHRLLAEGVEPSDRDWWLVVSDDDGSLVGAAVRSTTFGPYPPFLLPMPDDAAVSLARALHERGELVWGINGALPAAAVCAAEVTRLAGGRVEVSRHTRLHELGELVPPAPVPGRLVVATLDDVDLVSEWLTAFMGDADEQAGRPRGANADELPEPEVLRHNLRSGRLWFWVDESGRPVHLTGANPPAFGVARIGPVYTPPAERGRGWASNAVAEVSRLILAEGARACLFTDQANPTSNKIYTALGYRPVVDMANLVIV
jgi:hypothetical protein